MSSRKKSKRKNHKHHLSIAEILLTSINDPQSPDIQGHGNKNSNTNKNIPLRRNRNYKNLSIVQQESISIPSCEEQMFRNEYPCYENYRNEEKRYLDQYHNRSYPFGYKRPIPERNMPCLNYVHNDIVSIPAAHVLQSVSTVSIQPNEKRQQNKPVKDNESVFNFVYDQYSSESDGFTSQIDDQVQLEDADVGNNFVNIDQIRNLIEDEDSSSKVDKKKDEDIGLETISSEDNIRNSGIDSSLLHRLVRFCHFNF